ncbi:SIMPL domain-containing protein [Nitrosopumilus maritimus]|uniref:Outer membrane protein n=1 Tax=Nitrosopumilus maritimus (strain SCM1) TaxID=436308 RepID=A9A2L7_NITMS|nr:SIMPL domain-containing protein [Nitrosopumilus maritimus]ABX13256.1 protein of unknown function DUF541 [Nitrosopumilus maritimus SCM1]
MNKKQLTVVMLSVLVVAVSATAVSSEADAQKPTSMLSFEKTIDVVGIGMISTDPDLLTIRLGLETKGDTANDALTANSAQMSKILQALKSVGISESEISTSSLNIRPQYEYVYDETRDRDTRTLVGYEASNIVTVETKSLDLAASIIDASVNAGANKVDSVYYSLSTETQMSLKDQLLEQAVINAQEKAKNVLAPLDQKIIGVKSISVSEFGIPTPYPVFSGSNMVFDAAMKSSSTQLFSSEQDVTASVHVVFHIGSN